MATRKAAAPAEVETAAHPPMLCDDVAAVGRALVAEGGLLAREALTMLAPVLSALWRHRGGPAIVEENPEAHLHDRVLLYAIGEAVPTPVGPTVSDVLGKPAPAEEG